MAERRPQAVPARIADLFESASELVHRTAWRITGRAEDAEDVLQHVFLAVLQTFPPEPWPDNPVGYVRRSAVNASLDVLRRRKRWASSPLDEAHPASEGLRSEDVAAERLDGQRLAERLRLHLSTLSPLEAEVFALRAFEDLSNAEIATLLGKTPNHVGVTLHAARQKLKSALAASGDAGPAPEEASR